MYVTRPLSAFKRTPEEAQLPPPEGPNSGYLVVMDEEAEVEATRCWGLCEDNRIRNFPFPQNKLLTVHYTYNTHTYSPDGGHHNHQTVYRNKAYFIPVLGQPLSSNRYYVIEAEGKYKGYSSTCSREEDMGTCCFCSYINDVKPRALDYTDIYQQVEVIPRRHGYFVAKSIAPDSFPPKFLRRKGWEVSASAPRDFQLGEACGLDVSLRRRLPGFDFLIANKHSERIRVGKWYVPFMFIKEDGISLKDQMEKSMFYEMRLEKLWIEIHRQENNGTKGNAVVMNANVQRESATVFGEAAVLDNTCVVDGVMWLSGPLNIAGGRTGVGLSMAIVERMKWEASRGGWIDGEERNVMVDVAEEFTGGNAWSRFGCYVLVERFVLRRNDGSLVITYEFRHTNVIQSKWE